MADKICIFCNKNYYYHNNIIVCNYCYEKIYDIKCNICDIKLKIDLLFYLNYPDLKNIFTKKIDILAHWINFGIKEQRCITNKMKWLDDKIYCNSCFNKKNKKTGGQCITVDKIYVLIAFCQPEWKKEKLEFLYDFLQKNYDTSSYHFVVYNFVFPNGFGYLNHDMINLSNISSTYDILILGNNYNQVNYNPDWYNICIDMLKLNKKIGIVNSCLGGDFYCPSGYTNNEGIYQCNLLREKGLYKDEHYHLVEKIILFLPRYLYYPDYKVWFFGLNDGNYHPDAYNNNKKILLDPIITNDLMSKEEFFNYYNIPIDKKLIVYYPAIFSQVFWKSFTKSHPAIETIEKTVFKDIDFGYWELSEIQRLFFYNLNFIADLMAEYNYVLMIKLHPENHHFKWGYNCFRDDTDDKSSDPINYINTNKIHIINNNHIDELTEYVDKVIITSDTASAHISASFNIPAIYFNNRKYDWIKYCTGGANDDTMYGNLIYKDEIFDENNKLNKVNLTRKFTDFFDENKDYEYKEPKNSFFKKTTLKKQFDIILNNLK